ncbi:hypothetical protein F53441_1218 [Fusarium austroafricanum]|uniref:Coenzyme Q-binding protein COQ10 START domain-containing protein n=1 Tax=Fusarium austroafricanum TaxID=2364996 RepID=A0A8H4PDI4_9HYPO|nr:hypothetical protein F53441_1218 [Fusarium austroafricanum]
MSKIQESITIAAPPSQVWGILMDLKSWPEWNTFVASIEVQPPHTELAVGSKQSITINKAQTYTNVVSVLNPDKELRWNGSILTPIIFDTEHWCSLEAVEDGKSTRFTQGERFSGVLAPVVAAMGKLNELREGYIDHFLGSVEKDGQYRSAITVEVCAIRDLFTLNANRRTTKSTSSPISAPQSSTPSTTLSAYVSEDRATETSPIPLQSCCGQKLTPSHGIAETSDPVSMLSLSSLSDWDSSNMLDPWNASLDGSLPDGLLHGPQDLTGTWDLAPNLGTYDLASMAIPTFDDPLSAADSFDLGGLFNDIDIGQIHMLDSWSPGDVTASEPHDSEKQPKRP